VRAIDFDQQSYEGRKIMYLPQFFKENTPIVEMCSKLLTTESLRQYQTEERALMARRVRAARYRLKALIDCMRADEISTSEKTQQLKDDLNHHHHTDLFSRCQSMGDVVRLNLRLMLLGQNRSVKF
jgi:hypothetical protein